MPHPKRNRNHGKKSSQAHGRSLTRRSLLGSGALLGLAAGLYPAHDAYAWSSWTNITSPILKEVGMGDCVHEDLVQISYARLLRNHMNDAEKPESLLNPWAGKVETDPRYATIAGDMVDLGDGKAFVNDNDLAARLFRENLAYLRIGSFWNDAATNTLLTFASSCFYANDIPTFSGSDYYEGAWDVGQHLYETNQANQENLVFTTDALVQFTMNDRNNFIHGMLSSTASHGAHLKQAEVKRFALQWLGVAYEYARTGQVQATSDVTQEQAEKIFKGFIDTYGQLDESAHDMCVSLKVGTEEATRKLPHRRLRLRALGMMCHTLEDFWCPAHTCRSYHEGGDVPTNAILAFSNYKLQNGSEPPFLGYHIPFDRYAISDATNQTNWREALTRGAAGYAGTETLEHVRDASMACLDGAHTYFNTLGMNETIACITKLFEFMYQGTAWDDGVRAWVDNDIMPTYFTEGGQSYICDAGRRSLHTPTYIISPIKSCKRAYRKVGLKDNYNEVLAAAKAYDAWQQGAHKFFSGKYNTSQSKYIVAGYEGDSVWDDVEGEDRLVALTMSLYAGYSALDASKRAELLTRMGSNGCHGMMSALGMIAGMLQEFSIDLRGGLRAEGDEPTTKLAELRAFFESGVKKGSSVAAQGELVAASEADDEGYVTTSIALEAVADLGNGAHRIGVRDMESLATAVMEVPAGTPGEELLGEGLANLTITYVLDTEFEDDLDYRYVVTAIDYSDQEEGVYFVTGTVTSVAEGGGSLVLRLADGGDLELAIRKGTTDIPPTGAYICARYAFGELGPEFVSYYEFEAPVESTKVTYPVEVVCGSCVWLLTNEGKSGAEDGYRDYLRIEYGDADMRTVPREGESLTVYYHDEAYGEVTDVDEGALLAGAQAEDVAAQSTEDELTDSATAGYIELGDEYGNLSYGNEVFHVADVVGDSAAKKDEDAPKPDPSSSTTPATTPTSASSSSATQPAKQESGTKPSGGSLPKTDDPLARLRGLLAGTALVGAAMAAYSARRVAVEREESRGDDRES